jgi:hypothetical protein
MNVNLRSAGIFCASSKRANARSCVHSDMYAKGAISMALQSLNFGISSPRIILYNASRLLQITAWHLPYNRPLSRFAQRIRRGLSDFSRGTYRKRSFLIRAIV